MADQSYHTTSNQGEMERVRLSEWARQKGISRITAYRMLKRGLLPVPYEKSPTGRWYVLLPRTSTQRTAVYTRANPGPQQIAEINAQAASLSEWAADRYMSIYTVVREVADVATGPMPRLELLLADRHITHILIDNLSVLGPCQYRLLVAALAPQGRAIIVANRSTSRVARDKPRIS